MCKSDESRIVSVGYRGRCEYVVRYRWYGCGLQEERPKGGRGVNMGKFVRVGEIAGNMKNY